MEYIIRPESKFIAKTEMGLITDKFNAEHESYDAFLVCNGRKIGSCGVSVCDPTKIRIGNCQYVDAELAYSYKDKKNSIVVMNPNIAVDMLDEFITDVSKIIAGLYDREVETVIVMDDDKHLLEFLEIYGYEARDGFAEIAWEVIDASEHPNSAIAFMESLSVYRPKKDNE